MKTTLLCSAAVAALLLSGCGQDQTTQETANADSTPTTPTTTTGTGATQTGADPTAAEKGQAPPTLTAAMDQSMQQMHAVEPTGNVDRDFAHNMATHHRGGITMAEIELRDGTDEQLRRMAEKSLASQRQDLPKLEAASTRLGNAAKNYRPNAANDPFQQKMNGAMKTMMQPMTPTGNVDQDFAKMMKMHHQSGAEMSQAELAHGQDAETKQLAQKIKDEQTKEIAELDKWLAAHK